MSVLAPPTIDGLRRAFEAVGYKMIDETEDNWLMAPKEGGVPVNLPKKGSDGRVGIGVADGIIRSRHVPPELRKALFNELFRQAATPPAPGPPSGPKAKP